mmetsp:Transcript_47977/g.102735  ORF Transcript_47977/g.102735 Transcript_47977/m.102735 type:complete len:409 (+) Transcript_47977:49-1275(+)
MIIAATPLIPEAMRRADDSEEGRENKAKDDLMRAIVVCDEDAALEALSNCSGSGRCERETGYTALHHAAEYGMVRLVEALIDRGALLSARTRDLILQNTVVQPGGQTPLHLAARSGEDEVVDLLLRRQADPRLVDVDGTSVAVAAALRRRSNLAHRLAELTGEALPTSDDLKALETRCKEDGKARAGRILEVPETLRQVYTLPAVCSVEECAWVLGEVQRVAAAVAAGQAKAAPAVARQGLDEGTDSDAGWTTARHGAYATTDLPCSCIPKVDEWVRDRLQKVVLPQIARRHGWISDAQEDGSRLVFRDLFFVRYSAMGQSGLALHRDGSLISFNILLNEPTDFDGGGTFIEADNKAYQIGRGDCFVHSSKLRHGGNPITRGERYVLVGFIDLLEEGETYNEDEGYRS